MHLRIISMRQQCPLLAQSRHALVHCTCLLLGVKRTCLFAMQMSAFDPKRTPRSYSVSSIGLVGSVVPSLKQNRLGLLLMNLRDGFSVPSQYSKTVYSLPRSSTSWDC